MCPCFPFFFKFFFKKFIHIVWNICFFPPPTRNEFQLHKVKSQSHMRLFGSCTVPPSLLIEKQSSVRQQEVSFSQAHPILHQKGRRAVSSVKQEDLSSLFLTIHLADLMGSSSTRMHTLIKEIVWRMRRLASQADHVTVGAQPYEHRPITGEMPW